MQTETSQTLAIVSLPLLLLYGWLAVAAVLGIGILKRQPRFVQAGVALVGVMTFVTPLAWYGYVAAHPELSAIGVLDVVILGLLAFVGGAILRSALATPRAHTAPAAKH